jgi:hypothetical protein
MKQVVTFSATEIHVVGNFINKKINELENQDCEILDVKIAGRSNSYSRDWAVLILYDDESHTK